MDDLTSADQVIPVWLQVAFLGGTEHAIRLGVKSWFADMGFSTVTPPGFTDLGSQEKHSSHPYYNNRKNVRKPTTSQLFLNS